MLHRPSHLEQRGNDVLGEAVQYQDLVGFITAVLLLLLLAVDAARAAWPAAWARRSIEVQHAHDGICSRAAACSI